MLKNQNTACLICNSTNIDIVIQLSKLPLTGIYINPSETKTFPNPDQALQSCSNCGHAQLQNILDPNLVYDNTYKHRSSLSNLAKTGNDFFADFFMMVSKGHHFERLLEIGCNDLYLLKKLSSQAKCCFGLDPIWSNQQAPKMDNIQVFGKFIEELNLTKDLGGKPDVVISANTFEHIENPRSALEEVINRVDNNTLFIVEVPGFDSLLQILRFDQVFHQHIHYFSLASILHLITSLECRYLAHQFNYSYWGGTMLVAFKKGAGSNPVFPKPTADLIKQRYALFKQYLQLCSQQIKMIKNEPLYGFGAAQMLPTFLYHLELPIERFTAIIDDNIERQGMTYPNLPLKITSPLLVGDWNNANALITALDSTRPIIKRLTELKTKRILFPLCAF